MRRMFTNARTLISAQTINSGSNGTSSYYLFNPLLTNLDVPNSLSRESQMLSKNFGLQEILRQLDFENGSLLGEGRSGSSKSGGGYEKTRGLLLENMNEGLNELMLFVKSHSILTRGLSCNEMGKIFSLLANNVQEKVVLLGRE